MTITKEDLTALNTLSDKVWSFVQPLVCDLLLWLFWQSFILRYSMSSLGIVKESGFDFSPLGLHHQSAIAGRQYASALAERECRAEQVFPLSVSEARVDVVVIYIQCMQRFERNLLRFCRLKVPDTECVMETAKVTGGVSWQSRGGPWKYN